MRISVALATYNGEKYIIEQLQSILNQSRPVDEVVITDDCSTDHTVDTVQAFIKANGLADAWKISVNGSNLGFAENFRNAIDQTTGDLIFLCDQDDIWVPDRIEKMVAVMEKYPEIGLLNTKQFTFKTGEQLETIAQQPDALPKKIELNKHTRFLRSLGCIMCARKSFYEEVKKYWYEGWAHDEFLWCMSLLFACGYQWDYYSINRRIHEKQVSGHMGHSGKKRIAYLEDVLESSKYLLQVTQELGLPESIQRLYSKNVKVHRYRLELIRDRKWGRMFWLPFYLSYYYSPKSYIVELLLALKGEV